MNDDRNGYGPWSRVARFRRSGAVLAAAGVGALTLAALPSAAADPSRAADVTAAPEAVRFTNHTAQRTVAANSTAELRVACPAGTSVVGGGVDVEGGNTFTWVHATYPYDGPDGDTRPDDGWAGAIANGTPNNRRMSTYAVCAASGTFSYAQVNGTVTAQDGLSDRNVFCPANAKVVSGGVQITRSTRPAAVSIVYTTPFDSSDSGAVTDNGWFGQVQHRYGTPLAVGYRVFAICESGPGAAALRYNATSGPIGASPAASPLRVVACSGATQPVGVGASVDSAGTPGARSIHSLSPADGPDAGVAPDDAWSSRVSVAVSGQHGTNSICSR